MPSERPRTDLSPLQLALTLMLAVVAGIQTWNNFNNDVVSQLSTLAERVAGMQRQIDQMRDEMRRGRTDGGSR